MQNNKKGMGRRTKALLWMLAVAVLIGVLIAYEQISLLYVLATLAIVSLLIIVSFSDLEKVGGSNEGAGT